MALLRFGRWGSLSSHSYPDVSITVGIFPLWDCLFLQGAPSNTLVFRGNIEVSTPFLGVPLQKSVSNIFGGGSKVVGEFGVNFCVIWIVQSSRSYLVSFLSFFPSDHSSLAPFLRALVPWYPCLLGDKNFLWVLLCNCDRYPGKSSPWLPIYSFFDEEYINVISSLISGGISFVAVFPHVIWGGEN